MKALRELKRLLAELRKAGPTHTLSERLMVQVRQVLEKSSYRREFAHLHFMGHWVVHASLHDAACIYEWLDLMNAHSGAPFSPVDDAAAAKAGSLLLDLDGLRAQMRSLLLREALDTVLVDYQDVWTEFVKGLLGAISDKPIGVPETGARKDSNAEKYLAKYQTSNRPWAQAVTRIEVVAFESRFRLQVSSTTKFGLMFKIASANPFCEYEPVGVPSEDFRRILRIT